MERRDLTSLADSLFWPNQAISPQNFYQQKRAVRQHSMLTFQTFHQVSLDNDLGTCNSHSFSRHYFWTHEFWAGLANYTLLYSVWYALRDFIPLPRTKRVRKYEFCTITQLNFRSLFTTVCKGLLRFLVLKLEFEPLYQTDPVATCWRVKICQNLVISIDSFNLAFSIFYVPFFHNASCKLKKLK